MNFNFMGLRFTFYAISGVVLVLCLLLVLTKGFNYGIDFKGGNIIHVRFDKAVTESRIREVFNQMPGLYFKAESLIIQPVSTGQGKEYIIQYPATTSDSKESTEIHGQILSNLKTAESYNDESLEVANIGPTVGEEMRWQGIRAAILSVIGILLYLAYRFEMQSALGTVIALLHDLVFTLGVVTLLGVEFDVTVLAAILTMLGYSCNDSIVVLDRVRENRKLMRDTSLVDIINASINQTLSRTVNTSLTTLFSLIALLMAGGISIHGFALTLTIGVLVGTYSSIFIAAPVLLELTSRAKAKKA